MPAIRTIRKIISHDPLHFVFARTASWSPDGNRIIILYMNRFLVLRRHR